MNFQKGYIDVFRWEILYYIPRIDYDILLLNKDWNKLLSQLPQDLQCKIIKFGTSKLTVSNLTVSSS